VGIERSMGLQLRATEILSVSQCGCRVKAGRLIRKDGTGRVNLTLATLFREVVIT
jgi:hypothetical protein